MLQLKQVFAKKKFIQDGAVVRQWLILGKPVLSKERLSIGNKIHFCGVTLHFAHRLKTKFIGPIRRYKKQICYFLESPLQNKKIVLFSHDLTVTGAPLALYKIALILKENGWSVLIVAPKGGALIDLLKKEAITYMIIPHILQAKESIYQKLFAKFDAAICNTYAGAYAAGCLQKFLPTLLYIHEAKEGLSELTSGEEHFLAGLPLPVFLQKIKNVACVSDFAAEFYQPYVKTKIKIIRNFVDDTVLPQYHNTTSRLKIGYVGSIDGIRKKTDLLCEAFARLVQKYPQIELHIIGNTSGAYAQKLMQQYTKGIVWQGEMVGQAKDQLFNEMDIIVIPSLLESCSLVALEAAAYSKPVIITDCVGAKYMFEHQESAMIAKAGDVDSLAQCMEQLICDKKLRDNLSINARQAYEHYATREIMQKELLAVLQKIMQDFKSN